MERASAEQIQRAIELLPVCKHAAMVTVNADSSPHNTPFLSMHDDGLQHMY